VKYISGIPVHERTSHDESKIPLRNIARKYLPPEIIERQKIGFCSGLDKF
jgi:asparagine synthetase B (glutamine-hydrolysing)